jgi:hypothetical protein
VNGNFAFIASRSDSALSIFYISDPKNPVHVSSITGAGPGPPNYLYGAVGIYINSNYAYVTSYNDSALSIFDISDPKNPVHVGSITGAGSPNYLGGAYGISVNGNYVYIASWVDSALSIFEVYLK